MVRGLDIFRERFGEFEDSFILIGGAACDLWFSSLNQTFRATNDLDLVLLIEAFAWLDLTRRNAEGERIDSKKINKHRSDVFRLAATLPGEPGPELPAAITADLSRFLQSFSEDSPEWPAVLDALKSNAASRGIRPAFLHCKINNQQSEISLFRLFLLPVYQLSRFSSRG